MCTVEPSRDKKNLRQLEKILSKRTRNLILFKFGINSGLRISDILILNVTDIRYKDFIRIKE